MKKDSGFQGMRWFKCDLHMHTPMDSSNWRGVQIQNNSLDAAAENYIRRCYESGLEIIAVTDHNFSSKSFIPVLQEAIEKLSDEYQYKIILFPGFEISADVGKGMHVLALFEPGTDSEEIDHLLTNCGVPMPRQKPNSNHESATKRLNEIIEEVQKESENGELKGLIICPHPHEKGIFDNNKISEWLQQHEWKKSDLFAVEVPKPIPQMSKGWQRLFANGKDCLKEWRRSRPIAAIMSSDAKALKKEENKDNYIGKRFSWIKMSNPSIESLRQAFLDPESRIRLEPHLPKISHTHIQQIAIQNTEFLADQTVVLSPHLNCLIGGRGSGKSMLFESMRLGLRGEMSFKDMAETDHVAMRQIHRLRGTFTRDTRISLQVFHHDFEDCFEVDDSSSPARIESREVTDAATIFRSLDPLIFSQAEITQLADQKSLLLDFIDNLARDRMDQYRNQAREIIEQLKGARQLDEEIGRLKEEWVRLKQEVQELERQLSAQTNVQQELKNHRAAQEAQRYIQNIIKKARENQSHLGEIAEDLAAEPPPLGSRVENYPHSDFFKTADEQIAQAYQELAQTLKNGADRLMASVERATFEHRQWPEVQQSIEKAEKDFQTACQEKGLTEEEAEKLRETEQRYRGKKAAYQAKYAQWDQAVKRQVDIKKLLKELSQCWRAETQTRQSVLDEITASETMPQTQEGQPIVMPELRFSGNREWFLKQWENLSPPRNTKGGRVWNGKGRDGDGKNIGRTVFDVFQQDRSEQDGGIGNPIQWLEIFWENEQRWPDFLLEHKSVIRDVRQKHPDKWFELMLSRIPDTADLTLLRSNGEPAGSFQKDELSTGQKNTAILSLLLARGTGPVLIDQPEDELDSEFLYKELVPMFRRAKGTRQLIIVTHNANIPVNADAELIYALRAEGRKGICRTQGGLDRPEVVRAVLDIMEGSKEAFQKRREKYHF